MLLGAPSYKVPIAGLNLAHESSLQSESMCRFKISDPHNNAVLFSPLLDLGRSDADLLAEMQLDLGLS